MKLLSNLQSRIFNTPLAIEPRKLEVILAAVGPRLGLELTAEQIELAAQGFNAVDKKSYSVTKEGIAVIPVQGSLMKKTSGLFAASGFTSYEQIGAQVKDAMASANVKGILLDIDSPGGEVHGLFDLADMITSCRGQKPLYAVANDSCYSAAYAIASCADQIYVTQTGGVGSIGVYCAHYDYSKANEKAGVKVTYIKAGAKKTDGNPNETLSTSANADMQRDIDRTYEMFVSLVARNRAKSADAIINTEAGCFNADNSLPLLADKQGTFEDALAAVTAVVTGMSIQTTTQININSSSSEETNRMAKTLKAAAQTEAELTKLKAEEVEPVEEASTASATDEDDKEVEATDDKCVASEDDADDTDEPTKDDESDDEDDTAKAAAITRIVNLCSLAGHSEMAAGFINKGFTVKQAEAALMEKRATKSTQTKVMNMSTSNASAFDTLQAGAKGSAKEYAAYLKKNASAYATYMEERDEATATVKGAKQYFAEMANKISARG